MNINFLDELINHGMSIPKREVAADKFTRWGDNSCYWAKAVSDGYVFGSWKYPYVSSYWFPKADNQLSLAQLKERKRQIAQERSKMEKERLEGYLDTATQALIKYEEHSSDCSDSQYLKRKQVKAFGVKYDGNNLIVPANDINGKLWTYQIISPNGSKLFKKGGKKKGCFHAIGNLKGEERAYVCEGYATAASIYMATEVAAIVAFDANNLDSVIAALKLKHPDIEFIIAADDDRWKATNAGIAAAEKAHLKHGVRYLAPSFNSQSNKHKPTDFNDLHALQGLEAVKEQLSWI